MASNFQRMSTLSFLINCCFNQQLLADSWITLKIRKDSICDHWNIWWEFAVFPMRAGSPCCVLAMVSANTRLWGSPNTRRKHGLKMEVVVQTWKLFFVAQSQRTAGATCELLKRQNFCHTWMPSDRHSSLFLCSAKTLFVRPRCSASCRYFSYFLDVVNLQQQLNLEVEFQLSWKTFLIKLWNENLLCCIKMTFQ